MGRIERLVLIVDDDAEDRAVVRRDLSNDENGDSRFLECPSGGSGSRTRRTLVRTLTRIHGGRVEARSAGPGLGGEFIVWLQAAPNPDDLDPAESLLDAASASGRKSVRVLIVDDNVHAAESLAIVIKLWNHDARVAFAGPEAISLSEVYRPDVILLDIGLPGMDGYAVARALRARSDYARVLLVAMTGFGREEDFRRSREAGFDRHLVKPIDFEVLEAILDQARDPDSG
jgi:CheY-like chemotaxis protein